MLNKVAKQLNPLKRTLFKGPGVKIVIKKPSWQRGYSWEYIRTRGLRRYILIDSLLYWGTGVYALMLLVHLFSVSRLPGEKTLLFEAIITGGAALLFGITTWMLNARVLRQKKLIGGKSNRTRQY